MRVVFLIFAATLVWFSFKSLIGGIRYLRFFRTELSRPAPDWAPMVTVICPCRGVDQGMESNLAALLEQNFPAYEVIFVIDDPNDPARAVIDTFLESNIPARLVLADKAVCSAQKVENLRAAVLHANHASEVFVFVDSDTRVSKEWLSHIVAPLEDTSAGASTGYRWFISESPSLASELRSVWNASIASALGPDTASNFCWGGSTAIRRTTFERIGMTDKWRGTLSDDFALTRALRASGLPIIHVPQALTATVESCTFGELLEFTTRQMKITRVYMPQLWLMSFLGSALFCGVMLAAVLILIQSPEQGLGMWSALVTVLLVTACSIGKSWLRLKAIRLALPQYSARLNRQGPTQNTLWVLTPAIFLYNCLCALFSRRLVWRGTKYQLNSPTETVIIRD